MRISNQVVRRCPRQFPLTRGAGNNKAIGTDDPNTLHTNKPSRLDGHGVSGGELCLISLVLETAATITFWIWHDAAQYWVKLGSSVTKSAMAFDAKSIDVVSLPENAVFYLQGSVEVTNAWTDSVIVV